MLTFLPACSGGGGDGKIKVAIVSNNPEEFWTFAEAGAKKAAKDLDVEATFRKPDKGDVSVQMDIVNALVKQGIKGIAVSVINPVEQAPDLKQIASKVKLITMDNDADGSDRICYIGTDNYAAGRQVGRLVKEVQPDGGDIAIFVGMASPLNARERFWGVIDELAGTPGKRTDFPDPKVEGPVGNYTLYRNSAVTDSANREKAKENAQQALAQIGTKEKVCFVGLWAYNPPKILEAVRSDAKFKHVKIVGFDEDWDTLDGIDKGEIHATVVQDPFEFGYQSVVVLTAEAKGDTSKRIKAGIPFRIVTKDGGETKTIDGVAIKNLKATQFRDDLKKLLESAK